MNSKVLNKFRRGQGVLKTIKLPMFVLKWKGKFDAKKGVAIAETYIDKAMSKCASLENREVLMAEEILFVSRKDGAVILSSMCNDKDLLGTIPENREEYSALDIRANRRNANNRLSTIAAIKGNFERLVQINEMIIDINACLEQRILKTRHLCTERINAYVLGVREVYKDFNCNWSYDNISCDAYFEKHKACDDAIKNTVALVYSGGQKYEVV